MRYVILSDIHGNLEALDAVIAHAERQPYHAVLVLGDLVGYGADPNAVITRIQALNPIASVRGNHDKVAAGMDTADTFNMAARRAVSWTSAALTPESREYLAALPEGPLVVDDDVEICHGAPSDEDKYMFESVDAARALLESRRPICFFGHTHVQVVYELSRDNLLTMSAFDAASGRRLTLEPSSRYLVNPGSVGQPRDGDPRAAYGLLDTDTREVMLFRVVYEVAVAQEKIREAGLPEILASRLALGR
jgi:predicted phosphodiesterase